MTPWLASVRALLFAILGPVLTLLRLGPAPGLRSPAFGLAFGVLPLVACGGSTDRDGASQTGGTAGVSANGGSGAAGGSVSSGGAGGLGAGGAGGVGAGGAGGVGAGGFGAGGSGGVAGAPPVCGVDTDSVALRFWNNSVQTLYLHRGCTLDFQLQRCEGDMCITQSIEALCSSPCGTGDDGCIVCGACLDEALPLAPGESVEYAWQGCTFTSQNEANGCACHLTHIAPPGTYRAVIAVYASPEQVMLRQSLRSHSAEFSLPVATGLVEIPLAPPSP